jgi:hypothetical protein
MSTCLCEAKMTGARQLHVWLELQRSALCHAPCRSTPQTEAMAVRRFVLKAPTAWFDQSPSRRTSQGCSVAAALSRGH